MLNGVLTLVLEEDGTMVESEDFFQLLEDDTCLMVLELGQKWRPRKVRDPHWGCSRPLTLYISSKALLSPNPDLGGRGMGEVRSCQGLCLVDEQSRQGWVCPSADGISGGCQYVRVRCPALATEWGAVIWPGPGEAQAQPGHRPHHL